MTAQCKLYFDGSLIRTGTRAECENEFKHRVAEYQMKFDIEYSYQKQQSSVYDKLNDINSDLMQGVERPSGNISLSRTEITNKVNNYKKRFKISCPSSNNIVQPSPKTKRANYDTRKIGLQRKSGGYKRTVIHRNNNSEAQRIAFERKLAAATQDAETRSTRSTQSAYQKIDNVKTGSAGDIAMRQKAANDRAGRQIGFGVSGGCEEKEDSLNITFTDDEIKRIIKQFVEIRFKNNDKYSFVDHIRLCFEQKSGIPLSFALIITPGNKKKNMEIINSYNKYCERFTPQITNEACNELYDDWRVGFCEDNILYDMALLSAAVYEDKDSPYPWGWQKIKSFNNPNNSFDAALYQFIPNDKILCLSFRGSEGNRLKGVVDVIIQNKSSREAQDWVYNNLKQGLGETDDRSQHKQAVSCVSEVNKQYGKNAVTLYLTGHSLGGGLASIAGVSQPQLKTYTFNAAGVQMKTIEKFVPNKNKNDRNILAYSTANDQLTTYQNWDYSFKMRVLKSIVNILEGPIKMYNSEIDIAHGDKKEGSYDYFEGVLEMGIGLMNAETSFGRELLDFIGIDHNYIPENDVFIKERLNKMGYEILPKALGKRQVIANSSGMDHNIIPIVNLFDKNKNGTCISCMRKFIEQQRTSLVRFVSNKNNMNQCKINMN